MENSFHLTLHLIFVLLMSLNKTVFIKFEHSKVEHSYFFKLINLHSQEKAESIQHQRGNLNQFLC